MTTERAEAEDAGDAPDSLMCIVEIAKGSRNKYEYDREHGVVVFDRFLSSSVVYPTDYGFIADTLALDGDELDVLVCVTEPTFPGCRVPVRPVGMLIMRDENGPDNKIVSVPVSDPNWAECQNLGEVPRQLREEIFHFFSVYKDLDADRFAEPTGWADRDAAHEEIRLARRRRRDSSEG